MNDDMRLKSVVVKGPKATALPCLLSCPKTEACPCQALQDYWKTQSKGVTSVEVEWMYVPSGKSLVFWTKLISSLTIAILLVIVAVNLMACIKPSPVAKESSTPFKMTVTESGYAIEYPVRSIADFEQGTNDIARVKKGLEFCVRRPKND